MLPLSSAQIISSMGSNIIRTFDWRHVALLARVRDRGLCLDSQLAFTRGAHALQNALLDPFIRGKSAITLVSRNGDIEAVGQCIYRSDAPNARLSFFGPAEALDSDAGLKLLESLAAAVGEHGAPNLIAEVDERSDAFERLRSAGFAIYARQRIWRLVEAKEDFEPAETIIGVSRRLKAIFGVLRKRKTKLPPKVFITISSQDWFSRSSLHQPVLATTWCTGVKGNC